MEEKRPNALWSLFPLAFGIFGGIFAYLGTVNSNRMIAKELLKIIPNRRECDWFW